MFTNSKSTKLLSREERVARLEAELATLKQYTKTRAVEARIRYRQLKLKQLSRETLK